MDARAALTPAEALVMWKPNRTTGRDALKITLRWSGDGGDGGGGDRGGGGD